MAEEDSISSLMSKLGGDDAGSVKALDQLSSTLSEIDFKAVAAGNEQLESAQKSLYVELDKMREQTKESVKANKELLRNGKISGKKAKQISDRQATAMTELNGMFEDMSKNQKIGGKELESMAKATHKVNKELMKEYKLQSKINKGSRQFLANQKRQTLAWFKSSKRIEEATSGIDTLTSKLNVDYVGSGIVGAGKEAASRHGKGAMLGMGLLGGAIALLAKAAGGRQKELDAFSPKAFNYGLQGYEDLNAAILGTSDSLTKFRDDALHLSVEAEQAEQLFRDIGAATGETNKNIAEAGPIIFRSIQSGIIPAGEAAASLSDRINTIGISAKEAALEIEDIGIIAHGVGSVQMEDLYKSVTNVAGASDALATNQRDLARVMGGLVRQGDKLEMSYNRRVKAAESLTKALGAGYNQGFATLEVENDLSIAQDARSKLGKHASKAEIKQAEEFAKRAKEIADMKRKGIIDDALAADMLQKAGGSTNKAILEERMRRSAIDSTTTGGVRMAQARLGDLTQDQIRILQRVGKALKGGASMKKIMGSDKFLSRKDRASYKKLSKDVGKQAMKGETGVKAILSKMMNLLQHTVAPALELLPQAIDDMIWSINELQKWMKSAQAALPEWMRSSTKDEVKATAEDKRKEGLIETLVAKIGHATGDDTLDIEDLLTNESVAKKFKKDFKGLSKQDMEALQSSAYGYRHPSSVYSAMSNIGRTKNGKAIAPTVTGMSVDNSRLNADGSTTSTATVEMSVPNASDVSNQMSHIAKEQERGQSRMTP